MMDINNNTLFSIIVPAYNSALFINKCIESVLEQTHSRFELILVDDGSQDNTLEICESYARNDSRIKVLHKENGGHTSARNAGLQIASGSYILFLDSDDWLARETLELCDNAILLNDSDIVVFRMQNSNGIDPYPVLLSDGHYSVYQLNERIQSDLIMGPDGKFLFPKSLSGKCFKREVVFKRQMEVPKEVLIGEDGVVFIGSLFESKRISVIANDSRACYYCLVRPNSVSRTADKKAFEKVMLLLNFYHEILKELQADYSRQFYRCVVVQLYAATLFVIRSGGERRNINVGINEVLKKTELSVALKKAKFNFKGYKCIIKKYILRYRLWGIAKLLDR